MEGGAKPKARKPRPLPACDGKDRLMCREEFAKWRREILPQLRMPEDAPPRVMEHGEGPPKDAIQALNDALRENEGSELVRGWKMYHVPLTAKRWRGREAWKAVFWTVIALREAPGASKRLYKCFTRPPEDELGQRFIFVPSSRAHAELTDDLLLSGTWTTGIVVGGNPAFTNMVICDQKARGHKRSVLGSTPEQVVARRASRVFMMPCFMEWVRSRGVADDPEGLAEMLGFPIVDCESSLDITSNRGLRMAIMDNGDALVSGLKTLELQSNSLAALYQGTTTTEAVRENFFAHYDSQKKLADARISARLDNELRKMGLEPCPEDKLW